MKPGHMVSRYTSPTSSENVRAQISAPRTRRYVLTLDGLRDRETIDAELRLLAAVRWSIREHGGEASSCHIDDLLDERAGKDN
jgi:hypothetical protein